MKGIQTVQPFPTTGLLASNSNLPLPVLNTHIGDTDDRAYSYVLRSVKLDHEHSAFEQHGSAPNFQGDVLTLCTCKHRMRASQSAEAWKDVWVAGFTSRTILDGRHWLFYLARIKRANASQADLWMETKAITRKAKAAHLNYLGDLFKPKLPLPTGDARFSPGRYVSPTLHSHRWRDEHGWHNGWHNDIDYQSAFKYGQPPLLAADPRRTYLWDEPMIYFAHKHCRDYHKWPSLSELIAQLREAGR